MSFSNDVKIELAELATGARHCLLAELAAIVIGCGRIHSEGAESDEASDLVLTLETDQLMVIQRFELLLEKAFGLPAGEAVYGELAVKVLQALKLEQVRGGLRDQDIAVSPLLLQSNCCKRAFLAGAFLCRGTMSTPEKQYHFEIMCSGSVQGNQIVELMSTFNIEAKINLRKSLHVVYVKEADRIADMLTVMQAMVSVMTFENVRVEREIKGNINRRVNCETANISKTVAAAMEQIQDIELIRDTVGLNSLPEELMETANRRLQFPDVSLKDLGASMEPPVGKSGMNHRFQKLKKIAAGIREQEGRY